MVCGDPTSAAQSLKIDVMRQWIDSEWLSKHQDTDSILLWAADAVVKDAILEGASKVSPDALRDALQNRQTLKGKFRRQPGR